MELQRMQRTNDVTRARWASGQPADAAAASAGRTSWPPSSKCDVISKIGSLSRSVLTCRTMLPNFIPIRFETTAFCEGRRPNKKKKNNNKMSSDVESASDQKWMRGNAVAVALTRSLSVDGLKRLNVGHGYVLQ